MEIIFTDLIAKSYLIYTKNNDNDIAHLYYKEQVKVKEGNNKDFFSKKEFYNKLISQIQALINGSIYTFTNDSIYKRGPYDISNIPKESRDEYYFEMDHMYIKEKNNFYDFEAPGFNISNWEECEDAYILKECIYFQLVTLKDPVAFIDPSDSISKETLVLRKSKLEHLKSEAERASKVTSIDELDDNIEINKNNQPKEDVIFENDLNDIENIVRKHFQFTVEIDDRKKKQMLSQEEFLKLVSWVTYFFENNYELPHIDTPIMEVHISKTKIKSAFKNLIHIYHYRRPKPKSFYTLVAKCFYVLQDETEASIQKTSDPDKPVN
jgi:hypothetical protein